MANPLMTIVQNAIGEGKLRPENYRDAIRVSRDPEVTAYLEGLLAQQDQDVPVITDKVLNEETLELMDRPVDRPVQGNANPRSVRPVTTTDQPTSKGSNPRAASLNRDVIKEAAEEAEIAESQLPPPINARQAALDSYFANDKAAEEVEIAESGQSPPINTRQAALDSYFADDIAKKAAKEVEQKERDAARVAEFGQTLTLEDVSKSFNLQRLGATSGDLIKDGKLIRKFSRDEDVLDIETVITQENIDGSANLQNLEAVAGDLIIKNKNGDSEFLSRGREEQVRQGLSAWMRATNYLANGEMLLEALFPIPSGAKAYTTSYGYNPAAQGAMPKGGTLEDDYGVDISKLPFEERRKAVKRRRERLVLAANGRMFDFNPESTGAMVGAVAKAVIDPINLIPATSTVKGGIALGSAIAGFGSIADDFVFSESGEIDFTKAAVSAAAGAALTGVVLKGAKTLGDRGATKIIRNAQIEMDKALAQGANPLKGREILEEAGVNLNKLEAAQTRLGTKISISPKKVEQAEAAKIVANDSAVGRLTNSKVDKLLGVLSTRIKAMDEATFGRLRRFEFDTHKNTYLALEQSKTWVKGFSELTTPMKNNIARLLYNEDFDAARGLMGRGLADDFDMNILPMLRKMGDDLKESGHTFEKIGNYFPRLVKDLEGLQKSLDVEQQGLITSAKKAYAAKKGTSVEKLTQEEKAEVIDMLMRGQRFGLKNGKPGFVKQRKLVLTDEQMKYYATPEESLSIYLRRAVNDIEKRKFMGMHGTKDPITGLINVDKSIGNYVEDGIKAGRIKPEDEANMLEMLKSRFIGGEQSAGSLNATIRDLGYMGTIANPISAVTQLADVGTSGALNGLRNTLSSFFKTKDVKMIDIYLDEVSKELSEAGLRGTSKMLHKLMAGSGFKKLDRLGKETYINAAFKNAKKMVKSKKGLEKFKKKIGATYGDETQALIADLESGNMTDTVKYFLFNELADVQPITLSEFPQAYLDNPNHRILYMLKSFTVKQIDVVRRNVIQEYAKGNKGTAIKNAALLGAYLSTANTGTQYAKDILLGRDVKAEDIPDRAMWNLLSVYGINRYTSDKYLSNGDFIGAGVNTLMPATPIISNALSLGTELLFEDEPNVEKLIKPVPIVGNLVYNWMLGGAEEFNEKEQARRDK